MAQRFKLRFALRARENEEVDIEFLRISCACMPSLPGAQASSRNSGRCTSFSLNLHTSLMRHPTRLPRPTAGKTLRKKNPICNKGGLATSCVRAFAITAFATLLPYRFDKGPSACSPRTLTTVVIYCGNHVRPCGPHDITSCSFYHDLSSLARQGIS